MKRLIFLTAAVGTIALASVLLIRGGSGGVPVQAQEPTPAPEPGAAVAQPVPPPTPAVTLSAAERQAYTNLDSRTIQSLRNIDLGDYLPLREKAVLSDGSRFVAHEEVGRQGRRALGQAFRLNAVQFDLAEGDCVSFVNRTLALALAKDWDSYYLLIERIRHKDGVIEYKNRNFFTIGDWLPNNDWVLRDVTAELGPAGARPAQNFTHVVRPKVFVERPGPLGPYDVPFIFKGSDYKSPNKETRTETYVPTQRMTEVFRDLQTGDVILVLRPANEGHMGCDHLGLVTVGGDGQVNILHSAPRQVREEPLTTFLQRCHWVAGLKFLRLKDNARELAAQEVAKMTGKVQVSQPAEQDLKIDTLRANRAAAAPSPI